jgi:serine O-acetyltransferase
LNTPRLTAHADDLRGWILADLDRFSGSRASTLLKQPQSRWLVRLRVVEWCVATHTGPIGRVVGAALRWRLQGTGVRLGYTIPLGTLGRGIRLPHWGTIVISGEARVGPNCQIFHGVTLAADHDGAPTVADNVLIGANATVIGPVSIGSGAAIAAGAVVTKDVPAGETWAGVPARKLG